MKVCMQCKLSKNIDNFRDRAIAKDGLNSNCIACEKLNCVRYSRTKKGVINTIYRSQKSSSRHRGMPLPTYSIDWLSKWLIEQLLFHELYDRWVNSNYNKYCKPSVDRLDDSLSYTADNIQLMTWEENKNKYDSDRINGIDKKQNKKIFQYSKDYTYINSFHSFHSLAKANIDTNISKSGISLCCSGKAKTAGGFIWKYAKI